MNAEIGKIISNGNMSESEWLLFLIEFEYSLCTSGTQ